MSALQTTLSVNGQLMTPSGQQLSYAPLAFQNANEIGQAYQLNLTSTPVEVTLPAGTTFFAVQPAPNNAVGIHHKWNAGDSGGKVHPILGIPACGVDSTQTTFWLWSDSAAEVTIWTG